MSVNTNQFAQAPIRGQLDQQIMNTGIIEGIVSSSQATALAAGDKVALDTASGFLPSFIAANESTEGIGHVVLDVKKAAPVAGDGIQVALSIRGPVMWMKAGETIAAGAGCEQQSDGDSATLASAKKIGVALDPGVTGSLHRVILFSTKSA